MMTTNFTDKQFKSTSFNLNTMFFIVLNNYIQIIDEPTSTGPSL